MYELFMNSSNRIGNEIVYIFFVYCWCGTKIMQIVERGGDNGWLEVEKIQ